MLRYSVRGGRYLTGRGFIGRIIQRYLAQGVVSSRRGLADRLLGGGRVSCVVDAYRVLLLGGDSIVVGSSAPRRRLGRIYRLHGRWNLRRNQLSWLAPAGRMDCRSFLRAGVVSASVRFGKRWTVLAGRTEWFPDSRYLSNSWIRMHRQPDG